MLKMYKFFDWNLKLRIWRVWLKCYVQFCRCALISNVHDSNDSLSLIALKNKGGLAYPSISVIRILTYSERCLRRFPDSLTSKHAGLKLETMAFADISASKAIFSSREFFEHDLNTAVNGERHSIFLVKLIVRRYVSLRLKKLAKDLSLHLSQRGKRTQLSRLAIFKHL